MSELVNDPLIGKVLSASYRLDKMLGQGGMGAVYQGTQLAVEREVAIKIMKPAALSDPRTADIMIKRFKREAVLTSRLEHPNTVRLIDFGEDEGMLYLVLELLRGQPLAEVMMWESPLSSARVARIGRQICRSLGEAHAMGIVHRDLKPDNAFVLNYHGAKDFVKVVDFGISRMVMGESPMSQVTSTGVIIGTPKYMAPEQVTGSDITFATDLYALGIILYEMLAGEAPFKADSIMALAFKHVHDPPPPLPEHVGAEWHGLLARLLAKDPLARPASAEVVAEVLERIEQGQPALPSTLTGEEQPQAATVETTLPAGHPGPQPVDTIGAGNQRPEGAKRTSGAKIVALVAALVLVVGGAVVGIVAATGGDEDPPAEELALDKPADPAAGVGALAGAEPESQSEPASEPEPEPEPESESESEAGSESEAESEREGSEPEGKEKAEPEEPVVAAAPEPAPEPEPEPEPAKTTLKISSKPPGAEVLRGDEIVCTTPCDAQVLSGLGREVLVLKLEGYRDGEIIASLKPDRVLKKAVRLRKLPRQTASKPAPKAADSKATSDTRETAPASTAASDTKAKADEKKTSAKKTSKLPVPDIRLNTGGKKKKKSDDDPFSGVRVN